MKKKQPEHTIDSLLEELQVSDIETDQDVMFVGWYHVSDNTGIIAYFHKEDDALRFRLAEVNRRLNP